MPRRTVEHALFNYVDSDGVARMALRGESIELSAEASARGDQLGALVPEHGSVALPSQFPLEGDDAARSTWMAEATVKDIQAAAGVASDEVKAAMLAVELRRGDAARKTVVAALSTTT